MADIKDIKNKIKAHLPDAQVLVEDLTNEGRKFAVEVISAQFENKPTIEQHQMVYAAIGDAMREEIHALSIRTEVPKI